MDGDVGVGVGGWVDDDEVCVVCVGGLDVVY